MRDAADTHPLPGVVVELDGGIRTATDSLGHYAIAPLGAGRHALRFVASGYAPRELAVFLADSASLELDVVLEARPVVLPEVLASAPARTEPSGGADTLPLEPGLLRFGPGWQDARMPAHADAQLALLDAPGVSSRADEGAGLSVRGGGASEQRLLLDGLPVYNAAHFAGARSAIVPEALGVMDLHAGVSSVRFGGALSAVTELETTSPTDAGIHAASVVGPAEGRLTVESPLDRRGAASLLLAGRHSLRSPLSGDAEGSQDNEYGDALAVTRVPLAGGTLRLLGFGNRNSLAFGIVREDRGHGSGASDDGTSPIARNDLEWESGTAGATWRRPEQGGGELAAAAWWAAARTTVAWADPTAPERLRSRLDELGLDVHGAAPLRRGTGTLGLELVAPRTAYGVSPDGGGAAFDLRRAPVYGSLYTEWERTAIGPLGVRAGLRGTTDFARRILLEPRLTLSLRAGPGTRLGAGAGRTRQAVQSLYNEESVLASLVTLDLPLAAGPHDPIARADQLEASVDQRVSQTLHLSLVGYLRRWTGAVLPPLTTGALFVSDSVAVGSGRASGLVLGARFTRGRLDARLAAGLAHTIRLAAGERYAPGTERPWSLTGDVAYRPDSRTTLQASARAGAGQRSSLVAGGFDWQPFEPLREGGGLTGTPTNFAGAINALRLPDYLRVDLGARRRWPVPGLGALNTAVRIDNILGRRNALGAVQDARSLRLLPAAGRSVTFEVGWAF